MKTQFELLKEAVALAEANPEAQIHVCVSSDEIIDDYKWTSHRISCVELGRWYGDGEYILVGLDDIREKLDESKKDGEPATTLAEAMAVSQSAILIYTEARP